MNASTRCPPRFVTVKTAPCISTSVEPGRAGALGEVGDLAVQRCQALRGGVPYDRRDEPIVERDGHADVDPLGQPESLVRPDGAEARVVAQREGAGPHDRGGVGRPLRRPRARRSEHVGEGGDVGLCGERQLGRLEQAASAGARRSPGASGSARRARHGVAHRRPPPGRPPRRSAHRVPCRRSRPARPPARGRDAARPATRITWPTGVAGRPARPRRRRVGRRLRHRRRRTRPRRVPGPSRGRDRMALDDHAAGLGEQLGSARPRRLGPRR